MPPSQSPEGAAPGHRPSGLAPGPLSSSLCWEDTSRDSEGGQEFRERSWGPRAPVCPGAQMGGGGWAGAWGTGALGMEGREGVPGGLGIGERGN